MSTDDELDARLHLAGQRWREANPTPATVDITAATAHVRAAEHDNDDDHDHDPETSIEVPLVHLAPARPRRRLRAHTRIALAAVVAAAVVSALLVVRAADRPATVHPASGEAKLIGTDWRLSSIRLADGTVKAAAAAATLKVGAKEISGNDGCAPFSAKAQIARTTLSIGDLAVAAIGCLNKAPAWGQTLGLVHAVLTGAVRWSVTAGALTLTKDGVGSLTYVPVPKSAPTTDPRALINLTWQLTTIEQGTGPFGNASGSSAYESVTLQFDGHGHLGGADGCNGYGALATIDGSRIVVRTRAQTTKACGGGLASADAMAFDRILAGTVTWSITGDQLTVTKPGVGALVFRRTNIDPGFTGRSGSPSTALPSPTATR